MLTDMSEHDFHKAFAMWIESAMTKPTFLREGSWKIKGEKK